MLYREQTFAPRAFHSELQQQTNTVNDSQHDQSTHRKARLEPAVRDAQKLAQNVFPPWKLSRRVQKKWSLETGDEAERPTQPRPKGSLWAHPFFREKPWGRGCQPTQTSKGFLPSRVPFPRQQSHFMQGYPRKSWILDSKLIPVTGLRILIIVSGAPDSGIMFTLHGILHDGVTKNVFPK